MKDVLSEGLGLCAFWHGHSLLRTPRSSGPSMSTWSGWWVWEKTSSCSLLLLLLLCLQRPPRDQSALSYPVPDSSFTVHVCAWLFFIPSPPQTVGGKEYTTTMNENQGPWLWKWARMGMQEGLGKRKGRRKNVIILWYQTIFKKI